jgi:epoxyqueuosine reductase
MKALLDLSSDQLKELGIVDWGYTEDLVATSFPQFEQWIEKDLDPNLDYLKKNTREDLRHWWPRASAALVFLFDYKQVKKKLIENQLHRVAAYTLGFEGNDYHDVLTEKLKQIAFSLNLNNDEWKFSLDTQPILERDLAYRAGLGWFGKNSMLIHRQHGSYFIIGSLILAKKLNLHSAKLETDHCGQCTACVAACPTQAIDPQTRTLEASQCLSTWTIENRSEESPPPLGWENSRGEIFGCDICQDVCPWNRKPLQKTFALISAQAETWLNWFHRPLNIIADDLEQRSGRNVARLFSKTAFSRPGKKALLRTVKSWLKLSDQSSE